jgi:glycosyltransferase involved in cell wall biosynthesis
MKNIIVSSTQYPGYGGAATNTYTMIKYLRKNTENNIIGIFFYNYENIDDINYDPDNIGGIYLFPYKFNPTKLINTCKEYFNGNPDLCIGKNSLAPYFCKRTFNCYTIYLITGIDYFITNENNISAQDIINDKFEIVDYDSNEVNKLKFNRNRELRCIKYSDIIYANSKITRDTYLKIYKESKNKLSDILVYSGNNLIEYKSFDYNKKYDIILCCSNLERNVKNNKFLLNVLNDKRLDKYTKVIVGMNSDIFSHISNTTCIDIQTPNKCLEYFSKSKLLLMPSLFDSNPNTPREAFKYKCLTLASNNIGNYEIYPDYFICKNYNKELWKSKITYILENYEELSSNTKLDFIVNNNLLDIIKI